MNREEWNSFFDELDDRYELTLAKIRVHEAAVNNFEYFAIEDRSNEFLRKRVGERLDMSALFVDMVESTRLSRVLPERILTVLMTSFAHEMAYLVDQFDGYVLKFVGDAVIGYFVGDDSANRAARCAIGMLYKTKYALDEIFSDLKNEEENKILAVMNDGVITDEQINRLMNMVNFKNVAVRVGLNYGANTVVRYGRASQDSPTVDLIGYPLNLTAKIQGKADPNEVLIGEHLYDTLPRPMRNEFKIKQLKCWDNCHPGTDKIYKLYAHSCLRNLESNSRSECHD